MKSFAQNLSKLAPHWITVPAELVETFDWLEDQGWHNAREAGRPEDHWLSIYPPELRNHSGTSLVTFGGTALKYTAHWSTPNPEVDNRIFEIATTSGDGGRAAIWLTDAGEQRFVQIGHNNAGVITDDPLAFLQFLAMGYPEPGALAQTDITPLQAYFDYQGISDLTGIHKEERPVAPTAFQGFLQSRFELEVPKTARDIGIADFPEYEDANTHDPFAQWLNDVTPEPGAQELEYMQELMRTVESLDLKDDDSSETLMQKIGTLFRSKD